MGEDMMKKLFGLAVLLFLSMSILCFQWGFRRGFQQGKLWENQRAQGKKMKKAQQYIAECYKYEDYSKTIDVLNRVLCVYPPKGMKVSPIEDRDKITPEVIEMFKETKRINRELRKMSGEG